MPDIVQLLAVAQADVCDQGTRYWYMRNTLILVHGYTRDTLHWTKLDLLHLSGTGKYVANMKHPMHTHLHACKQELLTYIFIAHGKSIIYLPSSCLPFTITIYTICKYTCSKKLELWEA